MKIFSPGKLLITSEYVVLDGALALAVPTKLGQEGLFCVIEDEESLVHWEAYHQDELWLKVDINYANNEIIYSNLKEPAEFVLKIINILKAHSTKVLQSNSSYSIKTNLQFPSNFGLGSSSTLMNNLATWAEVDAYLLNDLALGGSGYDIAVAQEKQPILFQRLPQNTLVEPVDFNPSFKDELIFIHLNQKQDSREGIRLYKSKIKDKSLIESFSNITRAALATSSLEEFSQLMTLHEKNISQLVDLPTVKEKYFGDAPTFFKSLGAWGGDFILSNRFDNYKNYFQNKGYSTIFTYNDLIL